MTGATKLFEPYPCVTPSAICWSEVPTVASVAARLVGNNGHTHESAIGIAERFIEKLKEGGHL